VIRLIAAIAFASAAVACGGEAAGPAADNPAYVELSDAQFHCVLTYAEYLDWLTQKDPALQLHCAEEAR
jgi:hypothetical protein